MLPNHIQTCLSLLVKSWRVAVPAGKTSRQGHTVPASSQEYTFHLREEVSGESACRPTAAVGELNWWERTKSTTAADLRSVSTWCLFRAEKCLLRWLGSRCTCVLTTAACDRRRRCLCLSSVCVFFEDIRARWVKVMIHRRQKYGEHYRWGQEKVKKKTATVMLAVPFWKIGFFSTERTQSGRTKATLDAAPLLLAANATRLNKYKRLTVATTGSCVWNVDCRHMEEL